jgi:hypothetical protein
MHASINGEARFMNEVKFNYAKYLRSRGIHGTHKTKRALNLIKREFFFLCESKTEHTGGCCSVAANLIVQILLLLDRKISLGART